MTEPAPVLCSPWATIDDVPERVIEELTQLGADVPTELPPYLLRASEMLWMLSGRVWLGGGCEEEATLRSDPPAPGTGAWPYESSWGRCRCWGWPSISSAHAGPFPGRHVPAPVAVKLPRAGVTSVVSVTVGGDPFAAWELHRSGWLTRTDGRPWAVCDGNTVVIYQFGEPPPSGGVMAAVEYGVELLRDALGDDACRLPPNVVSLTRQGVSMELAANDARSMRTGLPSVDLWLDAVNPSQRPQAGRVWSPDIPRARRSGETS